MRLASISLFVISCLVPLLIDEIFAESEEDDTEVIIVIPSETTKMPGNGTEGKKKAEAGGVRRRKRKVSGRRVADGGDNEADEMEKALTMALRHKQPRQKVYKIEKTTILRDEGEEGDDQVVQRSSLKSLRDSSSKTMRDSSKTKTSIVVDDLGVSDDLGVRTVPEWSEQRAPKICGDSQWHYFDGFCYKLINTKDNGKLAGGLTWSQALEECKSQKASLASIHNKQENDFVASLSSQFDRNFDNFCAGFWIGMTRKKADQDSYRCEWVDGTAATFGNLPRHYQFYMPPWAGGQPDNFGGTEECTHMYPRLGCDSQPLIFYGQWNDFSCSARFAGAVCKKRVPIRRM